jgi:hypothetical protein
MKSRGRDEDREFLDQLQTLAGGLKVRVRELFDD